MVGVFFSLWLTKLERICTLYFPSIKKKLNSPSNWLFVTKDDRVHPRLKTWHQVGAEACSGWVLWLNSRRLASIRRGNRTDQKGCNRIVFLGRYLDWRKVDSRIGGCIRSHRRPKHQSEKLLDISCKWKLNILPPSKQHSAALILETKESFVKPTNPQDLSQSWTVTIKEDNSLSRQFSPQQCIHFQLFFTASIAMTSIIMTFKTKVNLIRIFFFNMPMILHLYHTIKL